MIRNTLYKALALTSIAWLVIACNSGDKNKAAASTKAGDSAKGPVQPPLDPKIEKLLVHFKDNLKFPVVIDSAFIAHVTKYDSLGANEVKMLALQWFKDKLTDDDKMDLVDFYKIDSIKAKHGFAKFADSLQPGDTKFSNAYGLQKIKLKDSTLLLIWANSYASYEADPVSGGTNIYGTVLSGSDIGITYVLAESSSFADPPSGSETLLTDSITNDGKLFFRQTTIQDDYDSMQAQVYQSFYQYQISHGKMSFKSTKDGGNWKEKIKE